MTKLSDVGLSVRAYNCLKAADIDTFADLVSYSRAELMKFRNFGRKSLNEIDLLVEKMKLSFGMDVTKYNIETKKKNVLRFSHDISARMEDNAFYYVSLNIDKEHSDRLVIVLSDTPTKYTYRARTRIKGFWHVENKDVIFYLSQYLNVPVDDLDGKKVEVFGMKYNKDRTKIALRVARKFKEL
jgi:hypothetical protein